MTPPQYCHRVVLLVLAWQGQNSIFSSNLHTEPSWPVKTGSSRGPFFPESLSFICHSCRGHLLLHEKHHLLCLIHKELLHLHQICDLPPYIQNSISLQLCPIFGSQIVSSQHYLPSSWYSFFRWSNGWRLQGDNEWLVTRNSSVKFKVSVSILCTSYLPPILWESLHFSPWIVRRIEVPSIKSNKKKPSARPDTAWKEFSFTIDGKVDWSSLFGKQYEHS